MWLKRLLKLNQSVPAWGAGENGSMGGGMDAGGTKTFPGQGGFFAKETPNQEEWDNKTKRRRKRKMMERQRKWRLSKDRHHNQ